MSDLADNLRRANLSKPSTVHTTATRSSLWTGPGGEGPNGGVTQGLLNRFLGCRERFRLHAVEGLQTVDAFNHKIEYGSMWHICEENYLRKGSYRPALSLYCRSLCARYPTQQEQIDHWYRVCLTQFPIYLEFWKGETHLSKAAVSTPLLQEHSFDVRYTLPSMRVVRLRGKWDSVEISGDGRTCGVVLTENKTKGDINEQQLRRQLLMDLQTMLYVVALRCVHYNCEEPFTRHSPPIRGVRYNVIRRPLSGGKGSIVRHKPTKSNPQGESKDEYYTRLGEVIRAEPESFFMRWQVEVSGQDIERFRVRCLDPLLENLCEWWDWIRHCREQGTSPFSTIHWQHPYGTFNVLNEGGSSDLDGYLRDGSDVGLRRGEVLFPELEGGGGK